MPAALELVEGMEVMEAIERLGEGEFYAELGAAQGFALADGDALDDDDDDVGGMEFEAFVPPMAMDEDGLAVGPTLDGGEHDYLLREGFRLGESVEGETSVVQSYEDLCRQHIENYLAGAEAYAVETSLSRRVEEWKSKLEPLLEDQEKRPQFDIHSYGESILGRFEKADRHEGDDMQFEELVTEEPTTFEICRIFAATLQLANNGNVDIIHAERDTDDVPEEERGKNEGRIGSDFTLKLLSSVPVTFESSNKINLKVIANDDELANAYDELENEKEKESGKGKGKGKRRGTK